MTKRKRRLSLALFFGYIPLSVLYLTFSGELPASDWRTASREPAGLAPDPATTPEAVVQVYSARAVSWRGWFGVHTWIAVKPRDASEFTCTKSWAGDCAARQRAGVAQPPSRWLLVWQPSRTAGRRSRRRRRELIQRIEAAVHEYPYPDRYHVWPGPTPTPSWHSCCARFRNCGGPAAHCHRQGLSGLALREQNAQRHRRQASLFGVRAFPGLEEGWKSICSG